MDIEDKIQQDSEHFEYEEYHNSHSKDDFKTWKIKKYINMKFNIAIALSLGLFIGLLFAMK